MPPTRRPHRRPAERRVDHDLIARRDAADALAHQRHPPRTVRAERDRHRRTRRSPEPPVAAIECGGHELDRHLARSRHRIRELMELKTRLAPCDREASGSHAAILAHGGDPTSSYRRRSGRTHGRGKRRDAPTRDWAGASPGCAGYAAWLCGLQGGCLCRGGGRDEQPMPITMSHRKGEPLWLRWRLRYVDPKKETCKREEGHREQGERATIPLRRCTHVGAARPPIASVRSAMPRTSR
jgi:hypothetical protein